MKQGTNVKKTISAKQLMYSAALFITASNLLTKSLYPFTKNETWIAVVIGLLFSLAMISIYGRLMKNHPELSLFEMNTVIYGAVAGKIVCALYVFFFLTLTVFNTRDLGNFVKSFVLPATPLNMIYAAFLIICVYAVKKGAEKLTRYSTFIILVYWALLLFISALIITKMNPENFFPAFRIPLKNYLLSAHSSTMLPFGEIFVFLTLTPSLAKGVATGKALRRGLIIGAATILLIVLRDIAVLGSYTLYSSSPTFVTIRLIDIGDILTRLEIINAVFLMILLFFKTSILLYATVAGIGSIFCIDKHGIFAYVTGVLVLICADFFFLSSSEHTTWFSTAATYSTFFLFILPAATLIVSEIKKKKTTEKPAEPQPQQ